MSAIKRASEIVGSQQKLATLLGVTSGAVSQWEDGKVPIPHCIPIEKLTGGAVRCEELQPGVDWSYLRATDCTAPKVGAGDTPPEHQHAA